jgi:pyruvate dehydrogenase E1 component
VPTVRAYDPAFAYELAVIVQDGLRRMLGAGEDCFYYLTVYNEQYAMPAMPAGVEEGIRRGCYKLAPAGDLPGAPRIHLFGSGAILREALAAQPLLAERGVAADVWSVTSYTELRRDALACERWNRLHPDATPRVPYLTACLAGEPWPVIAVTDYMKAVPDQVARFVPAGLVPLGTDGFGRSDTRAALRRFFEVDRHWITVAALRSLADDGQIPLAKVGEALRKYGLDPAKPNPAKV